MPFTYLYIEDNFVPNIVEDQFRRKKIGIGVTIHEGQNVDDAIDGAEQFIKEYIQKNTVVSHSHIQERYIPEEQLPWLNYKDTPTAVPQDELTPEQQIAACMTPEELEKSFSVFVKTNQKYQLEYDKRMYILTH